MGLLDIFSKIKDVGSKVVKGISDMRNIKSKMVGIIDHFKGGFKQFTKPDVKPSDVKLPDSVRNSIKDKLSKIPMAKIGIPDPDKLKNFKPPPPGIKPMTPAQHEAFRKAFNH